MLKTGGKWSIADAAELYELGRWGHGYFSVGENGNLQVHPTRETERAIDLKNLVDQLQMRGIRTPVLLRFGDILRDRLGEIERAFAAAIAEYRFRGRYACVYPVKVNQQRSVVEEVLRYGEQFGFGLEAGSKPELLAVMAMASNDTPIVCNGFKDAEYIETALLAVKMGRNVIPVIEKTTELDLVLRYATQHGVRPRLGIRVKLATPGAGRWRESGGNRSKFGLTVAEVLESLEKLKSSDMADCFELLHFHLGSQVPRIRVIKAALNEAARIYAELVHAGAGLKYLDVGGGLGVDYDGSQSPYPSSANYTLSEYANNVVWHIQTVCDEQGIDHPTILSESGRAVVAYHSALVFNVLGVSGTNEKPPLAESLPVDAKQPLLDLWETHEEISERNAVESLHDVQLSLDMAMNLFNGGYLTLTERALAERLYWSSCRKLKALVDAMDDVPEELQGLDHDLAETYFCNFSLFQSLPDSWAIKHLFPVVPIHRLDERPTELAVLGDITCDSDGKIDRFIDRRDVRKTMALHAWNDEPYYLGTFLVGAYQEILGDLHNLFGDTHAVHVTLDENDEMILDPVIDGDTVSEVLRYVDFDPEDLLRKLRADVDAAVREGRLDHGDAGRLLRFYESGLRGYTYLEDAHEHADVVAKSSTT